MKQVFKVGYVIIAIFTHSLAWAEGWQSKIVCNSLANVTPKTNVIITQDWDSKGNLLESTTTVNSVHLGVVQSTTQGVPDRSDLSIVSWHKEGFLIKAYVSHSANRNYPADYFPSGSEIQTPIMMICEF